MPYDQSRRDGRHCEVKCGGSLRASDDDRDVAATITPVIAKRVSAPKQSTRASRERLNPFRHFGGDFGFRQTQMPHVINRFDEIEAAVLFFCSSDKTL